MRIAACFRHKRLATTSCVERLFTAVKDCAECVEVLLFAIMLTYCGEECIPLCEGWECLNPSRRRELVQA